jgi:hypothetical protein
MANSASESDPSLSDDSGVARGAVRDSEQVLMSRVQIDGNGEAVLRGTSGKMYDSDSGSSSGAFN